MNESQKKAIEIVDNIRKTMENGDTKHLPTEERQLNVLQAAFLCILVHSCCIVCYSCCLYFFIT